MMENVDFMSFAICNGYNCKNASSQINQCVQSDRSLLFVKPGSGKKQHAGIDRCNIHCIGSPLKMNPEIVVDIQSTDCGLLRSTIA